MRLLALALGLELGLGTEAGTLNLELILELKLELELGAGTFNSALKSIHYKCNSPPIERPFCWSGAARSRVF